MPVYPCRVDSKTGLEHTIWKDGVVGSAAPLVDFRVTVYTSDIRWAMCDLFHHTVIVLYPDWGAR